MPWAEFSYNTSCHEGAGKSPFELVYGRIPPTIPMYLRGTSQLAAVDTDLLSRDEVLADLRANLQKAQQRMKIQADKHWIDLSFNQGDLVFVKLQPYK